MDGLTVITGVVPVEQPEAVLLGLLAAAPDALLAIDSDGRIVFLNDRVEDLFGWSRDALLGQPVERLMPERFAVRHRSLRAAFAAQPEARAMGAGLDLWARRQDGSDFPAEISLSCFSTADGPWFVATIRDVTVARRTSQRLPAVLTSAPDAMIGVDGMGRIALFNAQAERLFGWSAHEVSGKSVEVLVPLNAVDLHVAHRSTYVASPSPRPMGAGRQLTARRKDESTFPAEISLSAVSDELGSLLVLVAVRDATDRTQHEAQRQREALSAQRDQSQRLESLGQLAGGVAHDFNNLLGVILNYTTLLMRRVTDPDAIADLREVRAAAERAADLTRQLLTFARRDVVDLQPLEINAVVRGVASMLDRTLGDHITLRLDLGVGPLVAVADRHQVEQIVMNLAINARDAMPSGGTLTIATSRPRSDHNAPGDIGRSMRDVVLRIADTGNGMAPEVLGRAFEPFFTTKARGDGTGLGLATVYGIVAQHGGHVSINSTPGGGTVVTVVLPGAGEAAREIEPVVSPAVGGRERILLVEDEPALRQATARILGERGYDVLLAGDGVEALAIFDAERGAIDLVVTDVAMPRMRGDELSRRLAERGLDVPIMFMSGYDDAAPLLGYVLKKPVAEGDLLRAVRATLDDD